MDGFASTNNARESGQCSNAKPITGLNTITNTIPHKVDFNALLAGFVVQLISPNIHFTLYWVMW